MSNSCKILAPINMLNVCVSTNQTNEIKTKIICSNNGKNLFALNKILLILVNSWVAENEFDPYKALSQSTHLKSAMTYESATNELPLSSITFNRCTESPESNKFTKITFDHYNPAEVRHEISIMATNERPLSCTCLPKLLTANDDPINNSSGNSIDDDIDEEFFSIERIRSSSCPLPHGHILSNESQKFSTNFQERLNDYNAFREQKRSHAPRIFINNKTPKMSDLKSMRKATLDTDVTDRSDHHLPNIPIEPGINLCCAINPYSKRDALKKPIATSSSPQLSSNSAMRNAYSPTKQSTISISSNSTTSNISTNVNNTTIPHPNIVKIHNSDATQSTHCPTTRRQRHSIAGQMGFFKIMDIAGGFSRKMTTSTNSLFSTAVISGSSSAPNLHQINTASPSSGTNQYSFFPCCFVLFNHL